MPHDISDIEVPIWFAIVAGVIIGGITFFGIAFSARIAITLLLSIISLGISLVILYLLYRFVVAVEQIADATDRIADQNRADEDDLYN
ncbi:hypothetical protein K0C01_10160 [Salinarchaeum sp. IM2453]|uniref:hypothetical protein n=1 Tax=Salinarchaeum sp. IM2453 TaxID=2862870 RepID=UPI001C82B515|nr:hypothetical protein [Salinarchaeum sp. IM2453]QZA88150.1 hypothetical protein K0C01_10160 [Salinarchaeum sp. IM2453]